MDKVEIFESESPKEFFSNYIITKRVLDAMQHLHTSFVEERSPYRIFFLAGPYGCGKTSLLKALNYLCQTRGDVTLKFDSNTKKNEMEPIIQEFRNRRIAPCVIQLQAIPTIVPLQEVIEESLLKSYQNIFYENTSILERSDEFDTSLQEGGYDTLLLLVDELATYLNARSADMSVADLTFLLNLAEFSSYHKVITVCAAHESIHVLNDLLPYKEVEKIQNRFFTIPLHIDYPLDRRESLTRGDIGFTKASTEKVTPLALIDDAPRNLSEILVHYFDENDLRTYLDSTGIVGTSLKKSLYELCVTDGALNVLNNLSGMTVLRPIASDLGLDLTDETLIEKLQEEILVTLGYTIPKTPIGIVMSRLEIQKLQAEIEYATDRRNIIGIGIEGCDDICEPILQDLLYFYCTDIIGNNYEQILIQEKVDDVLKRKKKIKALTFGEIIYLFRKINDYFENSQSIREKMLKRFERAWILQEDEHLAEYLKPVNSYRVTLAHPSEYKTSDLRNNAKAAMHLLSDLFKKLEQESVYPPVISVKQTYKDDSGVRHFICKDEIGRKVKVYTTNTLDVGEVYFMYSDTNPIRVDPIIMLKERPEHKSSD